MNNPSRDAEKGKATTTTQQKGKATQHNLPETVIFQEKLAASGGTRTHDHHVYILCNTSRHILFKHVVHCVIQLVLSRTSIPAYTFFVGLCVKMVPTD